MNSLKVALFATLVTMMLLGGLEVRADVAGTKPVVTPNAAKSSRRPKIEWTEVTSKSGALKKPVYKKGRRGKKQEPAKIEFEVTGLAFRVSWETTIIKKKRGSMKMTVYKAQKRGDKIKWRRAANLGTVRGASKGVKVVVLGPGDYSVELEGVDINYSIVVEQAIKAE